MSLLNNLYYTALYVAIGVSIFITTGITHSQECSSRLSARECQEKKRELEGIEKLLDSNRKVLEEQHEQGVSIKRDISIIENEIYREELGIRARSIEIGQLTGTIQEKDYSLLELKETFLKQKNVLKNILQEINSDENRSIFYVLLSRQSLSSFFQKIDSHKEYNSVLQKSIDYLERLKIEIGKQQDDLIAKRHETLFLKELQQERAEQIEVKKEKQQEILDLVEDTQDAYQKIIDSQEKSAAQLRSELFNLLGTKSITIKGAIDLAKKAEKLTGVNAAFILAIIEQETALGKNLGSGSWRTDMHPTRDRPVYKELTSLLGVDPDTAPVSKKLSYGWGGAMGPAQFIPSTWACLGGFSHKETRDCRYDPKIENFWAGPWTYSAAKDRVRQASNNSFPSSPWNPQDAFTASALFLKDLGAARVGVYGAKWCAALRYYSGSCSKKNQSRYSFYPDTVERREAKFEGYINKF